MSGENKKTILLVEDEIIIAMTEKMALEKYGYSVITVTTGEKAIDTVNSLPEIDLIFMDIDLGEGIDGTEAAAIILQSRDIPVVFCSSHTEPKIVEKTEKITSYGYVVKSSSNTVLYTSIKMAFRLFDANRRILESEIKQKTMLANISDVIVIIDKDGINRYKSPNITKWFGWQPEELIGQSTWDNVHPEDLKEAQLFFTGLMKKPGAAATTECRYLCKNGKYTIIEITLVNLLHDRVIQGVLGNYHDITERKQAEESLRYSEKRFHSLFLEMVEGVYLHEIIYNQKGEANNYRIIEINPASEKHLHIKAEDAIGKLATELYGTEEAPYLNIYAKVAKTGIPFKFEEYFKPLEKHFHISVYSSGKGKFATIFSDITEQKQIEEEIKSRNTLLSMIMETSPVGITTVDAEGGITYANYRAEQILGIEKKNIT
ncbi:MAG: PAS domain S-box protein, partial [Spirochaetes bacterium]|nr:PAS domain S-box protein [Spirochaetota bacterium]